jgi:hypothetical protein
VSGYYQGDCGFENFFQRLADKGNSYFYVTYTEKGRAKALTQVMIALLRILFNSAFTQRFYLLTLLITDEI